MDIEIADLRLLRAVAETGSLAGAARQLGTNQGNLSRRLQRIERATGMVIFRRSHRGATPTAAGRLLLRGADAVLPLVDQLLATTATDPGTEATDPATAPGTDPVTAPGTDPAGSLPPDPATSPLTDLLTAPPTDSPTDPAADPVTGPAIPPPPGSPPGRRRGPGSRRVPDPPPPAPPPTQRSVQVGAVPNPLLPLIAGHVGALLPDAPIALRTADSGTGLLDLVRARHLDLAVFRHRPGLDEPLPDDVGTAVVARERLLIGVAERHRLAGRHRLTTADLGSETCILTEARHSELRRHFLAAVEHGAATTHSGARPMLCWAADEAEAAALACAMHAVLPAYPFPAPVPGITYVPLDEPAARFHLVLAWPPDGRLAPYAPHLAEFARRAYPDTDTDVPVPPPVLAPLPTPLTPPGHLLPTTHFPHTPTGPHAAVPTVPTVPAVPAVPAGPARERVNSA